MDDATEKITIRLPASYLRSIDRLVERDYFSSRSEAIRLAVRKLVMEEGPKYLEALRAWEEMEKEEAKREKLRQEYLRP
ncbi:MAG: ribbon-helix-helix domain-containing protein [Candidatus Thermoplasmatota archaeon]|nr:ribbon-helix-helix domain-containing protein [Candidatus Thermoplasmatota archaeon]